MVVLAEVDLLDKEVGMALRSADCWAVADSVEGQTEQVLLCWAGRMQVLARRADRSLQRRAVESRSLLGLSATIA